MYVSKTGRRNGGIQRGCLVFLARWELVAGSGGRWKYFRSAPAMFKIQIQRVATGISTEDFACEPLLKEIVQDINARIEQAKAAAPVGLVRAESSG